MPSLTLIPTSTPTPEPPAKIEETANAPQPTIGLAFEPDNAVNAGQLALWGRGAILQRQLAADGQVWIVRSYLGIFLYNTQNLSLIAQIDDDQIDQVSPDGQRLAVADSSRRISIYRLIDGQKLISLDAPTFEENPAEPIETMAPQATSQPEEGETTPAESPAQPPDPFNQLLAPEQLPGITTLRFSATGDRLAVGYNHPAILIWNLQTGQIETSLQHAIMPAANRIELSPDGQYLANNTYTNVLGLWSLAEQRLIWRTANGGRLTSVSFTPDRRFLLTESASSQRMFVWDLKSGSLDRTIQVANLVEYLNFSQDGNSLFFLTRRPQSGLYLIEQRSLRDGKLETFAEFPANYAIAPNRLSLAGMAENGQLEHFNLQDWDLQTDLMDSGDPTRSLMFSFAGTQLAAIGWQSFTAWSYPDMQPAADYTFEQPLFNLHLSNLEGLRILENRPASGEDQLLAYGLDEGQLFVWEVSGGQIERTNLAEELTGPPALSPDGRYLLACTSQGLRLLDRTNRTNSLLDRCKSPGLLEFSKDRSRLARASGLQIDLLSLPNGTRIQYLAGNTLEITSLAFSPDGSHFASGTAPERGGAESVVWDFARPLFPMRLPVPSFGVESLAFSADNQYLATGGGDDKIRIWRVADGWLLQVRALEGSASRLTFSPDDQMIAVGLSSGSIQLLSVPNGEPLGLLTGHSSRITGLAFSSDGTALYSASSDGTVRLWGILEVL